MLDKPKKNRILIVTRQAGSVAAFEPLLPLFRVQGWDYDILASDASKATWLKLGYSPSGEAIVCDNDLSVYHLILTGTSLEVRKDAAFWEKGETLGISTFAFVESWVNYAERFTIHTAFDVVPKYIGVVDELMAQRMIEEGAPAQKLKIVGHPRFSSLYKRFQVRRPVKEDCKIKNILIYTDPVLIGEKEVKKKAGYDAKEVVNYLLNNFSAFSDELNIVIKPHPREDESVYRSIISECKMSGMATVSDKDPIDLMVEADVVIGMNTILLIDSAMMGIPTYSFQPNRKIDRNDITDREGIKVITNEKEIELFFSDFNSKSRASKVTDSESKVYLSMFFKNLKELI